MFTSGKKSMFLWDGCHSRMFQRAGVGSFRCTMSGRMGIDTCTPYELGWRSDCSGGAGTGKRSAPKGREPGFEYCSIM